MLTPKDRAELRTMLANTPEHGWAEKWLASALDDLDSFHSALDDWDWDGLHRDAKKEDSEFADSLGCMARLDNARAKEGK